MGRPNETHERVMKLLETAGEKGMNYQELGKILGGGTYWPTVVRAATRQGLISKVNDRWYYIKPEQLVANSSKFVIEFDPNDEFNRAVWRHQVKSDGLTPEQVEEFYQRYMWCFLYFASATGRLNFTDEPKFEAGEEARRKLMVVIQQTKKDLQG